MKRLTNKIPMTNTRPGRPAYIAWLRSVANSIRTRLYVNFRCRWVKLNGILRIPWCTQLWSPHRDIEFGDRVQFGRRCVICCDAKFGNNILVAGNVAFVGRDDHTYGTVGKTVWDSPRGDKFKVIVDDDVWIGYGAIIVSGVTIGTGSIVAAGSVVTRDVSPYTIVGGNPAVVLKKRFHDIDRARHEKCIIELNHGRRSATAERYEQVTAIHQKAVEPGPYGPHHEL